MHDDDYTDQQATVNRYFYLHDRLGSVRMLIDNTAAVKNTYTYNPYGEDITSECTPDAAAVDNPWKYTGQYHDKEIDQYHLRARQYDPHIARFTGRDPINGDFKEPMTLHAYLYCLNDPLNRTDLSGEFSLTELAYTTAISATLGGIIGQSYGIYNGESGIMTSSGWKGMAIGAGVGALAYSGAWAVTSLYTWLTGGDPYGGLQHAEEWGIDTYNNLKSAMPTGTGLEKHHIIEQRLASVVGQKAGDMLSVVVSPEEHRVFTNAWRKAIEYGTDYGTLTKDFVWERAQEIYADYPALLARIEPLFN